MRVNLWAIGLFLIVGVALFTAILFLIGNRQNAFARHFTVYTELSNLGGLATGAKVRVSGMDAGKLKQIDVPHEPQGKFRLQLELDEKVRGMLRSDSIASIETEGVVGDKFILIRKGTRQGSEINNNALLRGKEPVDLGELLEKGSGLLTDVQGTLTDVRGRLDGTLDSVNHAVNHVDNVIGTLQPNLQKIAADGTRITGNINALLVDVNAGKGPVGLLLKDETTRQQLQATLAHVQEASLNLDEVTKRVDQTMSDVQSRQLVQKVDLTLKNVQTTSQNLDLTLREAFAEDSIGQTGGHNLRETISNLNRSTANLADDTEALKHNFFFRSFFKKRGFYSLDQLTPPEYEAALKRQKKPGDRIWFTSTELYAPGPDGQDILTREGRSALDARLGQVIDILPSRLLVIEGYEAAGTPDSQFTRSRHRATLVRQYLEQHFHVRHNNIGVVPMRSEIPPEAGRTNFDGAAVMVLNENAK